MSPQVDLSLDFEGDLLRVSSGFDIAVSDFFHVSGAFAFEKSTEPVTVTLTDQSLANVEIMTIGGSNVTAFAGVNGPAGQDGAMGLSLFDVNFALVLSKLCAGADEGVQSFVWRHSQLDGVKGRYRQREFYGPQ
jgi:hypothetical protein